MESQTFISVMDQQVAPVQNVLYTGKTHVTGGRDGYAESNDKNLQTKLSSPGSQAAGTNPEQLFAAGWSACFIGAMQHSAPALGIKIPDAVAVDAEVDLVTAAGGFMLQARLWVQLPGLPQGEARQLVEAAHKNCPYSKATHGNINVQIHMAI